MKKALELNPQDSRFCLSMTSYVQKPDTPWMNALFF